MRPFWRALSGEGVYAEYARTAPMEGVSVTRPFAIGVAFTPQPLAVWDVGARGEHCARVQPEMLLTA